MANPKRTSNIGVNVEYVPVDRARTSNIGVMVEYKPVHRCRTSVVGVMIEYRPGAPAVEGRVLGPPLQNC